MVLGHGIPDRSRKCTMSEPRSNSGTEVNHVIVTTESVSDDSCSHGTAGMAATLVALHVAAHAEGFAAAGMRAAEGLLAGVAVRVDTERRGPRECLVAGAADVTVVVLLVGRRARGREVVVVLPGWGDWRDHLLRWEWRGSSSSGRRSDSWSLVIDR